MLSSIAAAAWSSCCCWRALRAVGVEACIAAALAAAATAAMFVEAPSAAELSSPGRTGPALGG